MEKNFDLPTNYSIRDFMTEAMNCEGLSDTARLFAEYSIYKLDMKNQERKNHLTPTQIANNQLKPVIMNCFVEGTTQTASTIAKTLEITTQKASALLRQLVTEGKLTASQTKEGKTYALVTTEASGTAE